MAKTRIQIPRGIQEQVLKEYEYLCAVCGGTSPQLHHIDEDPSNNDPLNLLPLCPNCHLVDQHNPTRQIDIGILRLFRRYRDPAILTPQFSALYRRLEFLLRPDLPAGRELDECISELLRFIGQLTMGEFYRHEIAQLLARPRRRYSVTPDDPVSQARYRRREERDEEKYRQRLLTVPEQVVELTVEMLRFQDWLDRPRGKVAK